MVKTPFTNKLKLNQKIPIPIANGEGRYFVDAETLNQLKKNNQIVFSYENKINGSVSQIAGVCNSDGNVVALQKGGSDGFTQEELIKCAELSIKVGSKIREIIKQSK